MTIAKVFTKRARKELTQLLSDIYQVCIAMGMKHEDIEWLKHPRVTSTAQFVLTTYRGMGLSTHIDLNFQGPVIVITVLMKKNERVSEHAIPKGIYLGQWRKFMLNQHAFMPNKEKQMYVFWGWVTDWAYHGVPWLNGWVSVVFIVRQGRWTEIVRDD